MTRPPLHPAWRRYRRLWWIFLGMWLGFVPGMIVLTRLLGPLVGENQAGVTLMVAWSITWIATGLRLSAFRCPRCGARFFERRSFTLRPRPSSLDAGQPPRSCPRCGLPKWADPGLTHGA